MSTPRQAAAWLGDERANLHAAAGYAAVTGQPLHAMLMIPAAMADFLEVRGHWDQGLALHQSALAAARQAGDLPGQARALVLLANMQVLTSDLASAAATYQQAQAVYRDLGDRAGQADAANGLGFTHTWTSRFAQPSPAISRRWNCSTTSVTGVARPKPLAGWVRCTR